MDGFTADAKGVDNGHQHVFGIHRRVGRHARGWTRAIEPVMRFHASAFTQSRKRAQAALQFPKAAGKSHQGLPARSLINQANGPEAPSGAEMAKP